LGKSFVAGRCVPYIPELPAIPTAVEEKKQDVARLVAFALQRSSGLIEDPTPAHSGNQLTVRGYYKGNALGFGVFQSRSPARATSF